MARRVHFTVISCLWVERIGLKHPSEFIFLSAIVGFNSGIARHKGVVLQKSRIILNHVFFDAVKLPREHHEDIEEGFDICQGHVFSSDQPSCRTCFDHLLQIAQCNIEWPLLRQRGLGVLQFFHPNLRCKK